jgi:hypothetical protein
MGRRRRDTYNTDQFDLFEPPHEPCEDGRGSYLQFLIAPPTELGEPGPWAAKSETPRKQEYSSAIPSS